MRKVITSAEFDRMFDEGKDIDDLVDWSKAHHPNLEKNVCI
ncbi:MAG: hypothetical protein OXF46_08870 [Rhodobacteraceae bacterium]|nr:hypothetical protein [Paracoccaceae bacterium]